MAKKAKKSTKKKASKKMASRKPSAPKARAASADSKTDSLEQIRRTTKLNGKLKELGISVHLSPR